MKTVLSLLLAFAIGAACRSFEIPVPAPPRITGALLILAITLGYLAADRMLPAPNEGSPAPSGGQEAPAEPPGSGL